MADTYTITAQQQVTDVSDVTNPIQAMRVSFKSAANGVAGFVTIPLSDYTPSEVARLVGARVADIDAVHEL